MEQRNQQPSTQQHQEPAPASSKASVEVVGRYLTHTGAIGVEIETNGMCFGYTGAWGANSGLSLSSMRATLRSMLAGHSHAVDLEFWGVSSAIPELGPEQGSWLATSPGGYCLEVHERAHAVQAAEIGWTVTTLPTRVQCFPTIGEAA